ncbi:MAG: site-2 protease family protein [Planctomycetota bacterium]
MTDNASISDISPNAADAVHAQKPLRPLTEDDLRTTPRRRRVLPIVLFLVTCFSTFWAGALEWNPVPFMVNGAFGSTGGIELRRILLNHWPSGLVYMGAIIAILLFHEMGHFLATVRYRIPASFPFFIPFPLSPIGTMGAVIGMAGHRADRKQTFDIGIAGPLAGLVVAIPVLWMGIRQLDLTTPVAGSFQIDCPLIVQLMLPFVRPDLNSVDMLWISQTNPLFMAAWVGLLITGLNMMPISQLDGGHVIYALLLKKGHWFARLFLIFAISYVVLAKAYMWSLMIIIVIFIGTDHPPTSNDKVELGWFRTILGYASLTIPFICFPAQGIIQ